MHYCQSVWSIQFVICVHISICLFLSPTKFNKDLSNLLSLMISVRISMAMAQRRERARICLYKCHCRTMNDNDARMPMMNVWQSDSKNQVNLSFDGKVFVDVPWTQLEVHAAAPNTDKKAREKERKNNFTNKRSAKIYMHTFTSTSNNNNTNNKKIVEYYTNIFMIIFPNKKKTFGKKSTHKHRRIVKKPNSMLLLVLAAASTNKPNNIYSIKIL